MNRRIIALFFSILTACTTGAVIAFVGIFSVKMIINKVSAKNTDSSTAASITALKDEILTQDSSVLEEADQDPTFVSRFSRVFIYASDSGKEVIESAKGSLPKKTTIKVTAPAYMVFDIDRKTAVMEKNAEKILPIASVSKLVTAVVAKKILAKNQNIIITPKVLNTYGNEAKLREGEKYKLDELLYPLLMVSSNDASEAIAQSYIGGRKKFLEEMNTWVGSIGAYRTSFSDPSGLSPLNVSTAKDLAIITQWIYENERDIFDITLTKSKTIRLHTWINPTHFLNLDSYVGGKNGYTPEANRTSVSLFKLGKQNRLYAVMLMGSSSRDTDILDLLEEAVR